MKKIGEYVDWDNIEEGRWGKFMRIQAVVDLTKPLKWGLMVRDPNGKAANLFFKYEHLFNFYYVCG